MTMGLSGTGRAVQDMTVEVAGKQLPFTRFDTTPSAMVSGFIFKGFTYPDTEIDRPVRVVLDVGANIGAASLYFSVIYPEAAVYSFEPAGHARQLLERNVADRYQVSVEPFGLFSHDAELDLFEGLEDTVTSSIAAGPETTSVGEPIRLRDAAEWLAERSISQIDVLKLDTEGCEVPILGRLSAYVDSTAIIHVEYHSDADRRAIDRMLEGTHALVNANVRQINRGELTYVLRAALPPGRLEQGAITLPASLDQPAYDVRPIELSGAASGSHRG